ncbi:sugar ABC transporter xylitol/L-sorbitol-binding protein XypA [Pseudolysinimonas kribbensis]|jgi:ribose transport system substrate-binding protein|uniref:Xylitol-binding protein n=1 Tax=Pseudolysinimonas kribbensis TaxID=433641 RepID=A0ABQ6K5Y0_9MICO|nr:sugar ABC transporter substrate-binding protein [Pseudolysinimonas kribbensis]GMA96015.1 xylitol-binding protein [Pseudolysinimonas kribbensis]
MKRILAAAAAVVIAVGLAACSSGGSGGGSSDAGSGSGQQKTLGIVALVATDALNKAVIDGATEVAKKDGWKVVVTDTQGSVDKANAAMTTFSTTQKVDAIAVMAFLSSALGSGLASAKAADIPVVSWGGELVPGIAATTSAEAVGKQSVDDLIKDFGDKGSVLALTYHTGVLCLYRGKAFDAAMAKESGIKVTRNEVAIPGQVNDGTNFTSAWLANHPAGSGPLAIWGSWDEPAMGAIAALKQAGRTDVKVYAINGGPQALQAVKDGTLEQVVWQDGVSEGKQLMESAAGALKAGTKWKQKTINVPGVTVTKDNIDQFLADHPDALK